MNKKQMTGTKDGRDVCFNNMLQLFHLIILHADIELNMLKIVEVFDGISFHNSYGLEMFRDDRDV